MKKTMLKNVYTMPTRSGTRPDSTSTDLKLTNRTDFRTYKYRTAK